MKSQIGLVMAVVLACLTQVYASELDVYDWDVDMFNPIGQIDTIATAQTGRQHYDFFSDSGHPANVNLATYNSNLWVHENLSTNEFTFGFIFSSDGAKARGNSAEVAFRIVGSGSDVFTSVGDDKTEVNELSPGWFEGSYRYANNTDGIAVSGITGTDWTIMIESVVFGDIQNWYAASGATGDFSDDLTLTMGHRYRIVPAGTIPFGSPIPEPSNLIVCSLLAALVTSVGWWRRRRAA